MFIFKKNYLYWQRFRRVTFWQLSFVAATMPRPAKQRAFLSNSEGKDHPKNEPDEDSGSELGQVSKYRHVYFLTYKLCFSLNDSENGRFDLFFLSIVGNTSWFRRQVASRFGFPWNQNVVATIVFESARESLRSGKPNNW